MWFWSIREYSIWFLPSSENLNKLHNLDFYSRQALSACKPYKKVDLDFPHKVASFPMILLSDTTLSSLRVSVVHLYSFPIQVSFSFRILWSHLPPWTVISNKYITFNMLLTGIPLKCINILEKTIYLSITAGHYWPTSRPLDWQIKVTLLQWKSFSSLNSEQIMSITWNEQDTT